MEVVPQHAPGEEPGNHRQIVEKPERVDPPKAKTGPPDLSEWQTFFGRFFIKAFCDVFLYFVLGDFVSELTDKEVKQIHLTQEEMKDVAAPLASLSNRSALMKKHGRTIIAAADSWESVLTMLFWMRRVTRIAKKYRKPAEKKPRPAQQSHPQPQPQPQSPTMQNGVVPNALAHGPVIAESNGTGRPITGFYNPGTG